MSPRTSLAGSRAADLEQANLPLGLIGAIALHVAIVGAMFVTWTHTLDISDQVPMVPVDLVTLADKTNVRATVKVEPKTETPPVPVPQAAPPPQPEEAPPPPDMSAVPVPKTPPLPTPKPQPVKKKQEEFNPDDIGRAIDRAAGATPSPNAKPSERTVKGIGDQNLNTADLKAMLNAMISKCWSPPSGVPHADELAVSFELFLKPDGNIAQAPQFVGNSGAANDVYMRAAIEAARRAIYTCAPYQLPQDRYEQWRDVKFNFHPSQTVGQKNRETAV